jgi:hypothetical protein
MLIRQRSLLVTSRPAPDVKFSGMPDTSKCLRLREEVSELHKIPTNLQTVPQRKQKIASGLKSRNVLLKRDLQKNARVYLEFVEQMALLLHLDPRVMRNPIGFRMVANILAIDANSSMQR